MSFTKEQLESVETEIANLKAASFKVGEMSIDHKKTLSALIRLREVMKAELSSKEGMTFGKSKIDGIDG